jgi:hypothetical protein
LTYGGKKYMVLQAEGGQVISKAGKESLIILKTKTLFIAAHSGEDQVVGQATAKADWAARYLGEAGY